MATYATASSHHDHAMSSSMMRETPPEQIGSDSQQETDEPNSPLGKFSFFKGLGGEKKLRADGQPPKRRGPKPDSKPALTRRQELNRQAQRTHRERKEMYIKALEQEVVRMKEMYGVVQRERNTFIEENKRLRELLASHGISLPTEFRAHLSISDVGSPYNEPSSMTSHSDAYTAPSSTSSPPPNFSLSANTAVMTSGQRGMAPRAQNVDFDQVGTDFVLTLERPCMDHMQMLCVKSQTTEGEISGHALMATCPPGHHIRDTPEVQYPHQLPDEIGGANLLKLLDLSARLPLDGEITPIMAWSMLLRHPDLLYFTVDDFQAVKNMLSPKVRCYGFGAVLEEFEVTDAINHIVEKKVDRYCYQ